MSLEIMEELERKLEEDIKKKIEEIREIYEKKEKQRPFCPLIKDSCELDRCEFFLLDSLGAECSVTRIAKNLRYLIPKEEEL